jgi:hypothetical protein
LTSISSIEIGSLVDSLRSGTCSINAVFPAGDLIEIKLHKLAWGTWPISRRLPALMNIKTTVGARLMVDRRRRCPTRSYFDIRDKLAIRGEVSRDLETVSEAIVNANYLAANLRCLEPDARPTPSIRVIGEGNKRIHEEVVFA